jgi:hypothetical protein
MGVPAQWLISIVPTESTKRVVAFRKDERGGVRKRGQESMGFGEKRGQANDAGPQVKR